MQFAVYVSDKPVTLKQSQGHQTYNENVNPEWGYNHAKFERSHFNSVWEKGNSKGFLSKWRNILIIFLKHVQNKIKNSGIFLIYST